MQAYHSQYCCINSFNESFIMNKPKPSCTLPHLIKFGTMVDFLQLFGMLTLYKLTFSQVDVLQIDFLRDDFLQVYLLLVDFSQVDFLSPLTYLLLTFFHVDLLPLDFLLYWLFDKWLLQIANRKQIAHYEWTAWLSCEILRGGQIPNTLFIQPTANHHANYLLILPYLRPLASML